MISPLIDPAERNVIEFFYISLYILTAKKKKRFNSKMELKENCKYIDIYTVYETSSSNTIKWRGNWQPTLVLLFGTYG